LDFPSPSPHHRRSTRTRHAQTLRMERGMSRTRRLAGRLICATALNILAFGPAHAQNSAAEGASSGLEEIVVTARKRSESLINVPVAVTAVSQIALKNNLATDLTKLAELAPQVMIGANTSGTGAVLTIRGISSSPQDSGLDQSVSVEVDGVQLSRGRIITSSTFDIQQVQVLQGPQALFFGKNSPAGVISIHSVDPTDRFEGYIRGGYEFKARERFAEAAISGPLGENLKARLAMRYTNQDGWMKLYGEPFANPLLGGLITNPHLSREPDGHDLAGRLTVKWSPTSDFDATLKVTADHQRLNDGATNSESFCAPGKTQLIEALGPANPFGDCRKDMRKAIGELPASLAVNFPHGNGGIPFQKSTIVLSSLVLNKRFDNFSLTSTTGYYYQTITDANNADNAAFTTIYFSEHEKYKLITEELRGTTDFEGPINFTGGLYFEHFTRPRENTPFLLNTGLNPAGNYAASDETVGNRGTTYSVFGQLRWNIAPNIELAGGARYTHEKKSMVAVYKTVNPTAVIGPLRAVGDPLAGRYRDSNVSPEVTLTWHPTPGQTVYGAFKTGYKSGGFSNVAVLLATYTADTLKFGHETSKGFEVGYKAELFDRTLRFDLTAYRYSYKNLQVSAFDATTITYTISNAASARTEGVQGSFEWRAMPDLTFNGNFGYNRARFRSFPNAQCYGSQTAAEGCVGGVQDLAGRSLARAPRLTFNLGGQYTMPVGSWAADLSLDGSYSSSYYPDETHDPILKQDAFWRLNAALHLHPEDHRFDIALIGRNLTNSYYLVYGQGRPFGQPDEVTGFFNRPREIVVQAEVRF
jgi:outer membrane receptor protein involved in Fe transport